MKEKKTQPNKLYVGRDAKRDDGILFIYLFIYLSFNCFGFPCVKLKTGDANSQIRKKTFLEAWREGVVERDEPRAV